MAIYLGNTPIAENVTIQQGGGVTIDDTLSDTSKNPVQNKVINAALNSKAEMSDIPTSLPANGGNADIAKYIGTWGSPEQYYGEQLKMRVLYNKFGDLRFGLTTDTDNEIRVDYATNADTLDGKHASDFFSRYPNLLTVDYVSRADMDTDYKGVINSETAEAIGLDGSNSCWWHIIGLKNSNNDGYGTQIAIPLLNTTMNQVPQYRTSIGITFQDWKNLSDGGNADTLDGKHASDFALKTDIPTSLPANGGNADTVDGKHASDFASYQPYAPIFTGNILDITEMGTYSCTVGGCTNLPSEIASWCYVTAFKFRDAGYKRFICVALNDVSSYPNVIWLASESNKTSDGKLIWSKANDGGNADTVDGKHASDFVQKSGDSMSGNLRMETNQLWFGTGGITQFCFENTDGALKLKNHDLKTIFSADYNGSYATNADMLDGKHASDFAATIYKGYPKEGNCNNATAQGVYTVSNNSANAPNTDYYTLIVNVAGDGTWIVQTAISASTESVAYRRTCINGNWGTWRNVADGGNANTANTAGTLATTPTNVCLRNMSSGTAAANTTNCPSGAWYGQHS